MKKFWLFTKYYYLWLPVMPISFAIGVFLFLMKVVFTNASPEVTFFLGLASFTFLFIIPFFAGATALRNLIANPHTTMVPGFRVMAAIAHMLIAVVASIYLYINFLVFAPDDYSPLVMARTFIAMSAYAGLMQLVLPSRFFVTILSLAPVILVMLALQFRDIATALFLDRGFTLALFLVTLGGWFYGFRRIAHGGRFRPANANANHSIAWSTYDGGLLNRMAIGKPRSAEGTLLLGYPDNRAGIFLRVVHFFIITPLLTTAFMLLIGISDDWDVSMMDSLFRLFLLISLFSGVFCIYIHGEMVPRARLLWLRYGTDRAAQWRLVDDFSLRFLFSYYLCGAAIVLAAMLFTDIARIYLLHYLLVIIVYCCFNLYFSLFVRAARIPALVLALVLIASILFMIIGFVRAVWWDDPSYDLLVTVEVLLLMLGIACRLRVKQLFTGIDWRLVSINKNPGRMALTQESP